MTKNDPKLLIRVYKCMLLNSNLLKMVVAFKQKQQTPSKMPSCLAVPSKLQVSFQETGSYSFHCLAAFGERGHLGGQEEKNKIGAEVKVKSKVMGCHFPPGCYPCTEAVVSAVSKMTCKRLTNTLAAMHYRWMDG